MPSQMTIAPSVGLVIAALTDQKRLKMLRKWVLDYEKNIVNTDKFMRIEIHDDYKSQANAVAYYCRGVWYEDNRFHFTQITPRRATYFEAREDLQTLKLSLVEGVRKPTDIIRFLFV